MRRCDHCQELEVIRLTRWILKPIRAELKSPRIRHSQSFESHLTKNVSQSASRNRSEFFRVPHCHSDKKFKIIFLIKVEYIKSEYDYNKMMRGVYEIMRDDHALPDPLWRIVDSYIKLSRCDKVMYAFAVQTVPEIHTGLYDVCDALDEEIWLRYNHEDGPAWCDMTVIERLASMKLRTFRCEYIQRFHNIRTEVLYNSESIIDWTTSLLNESDYGGGQVRGTHEIKCKFVRAMFGRWLKK